MLIVWINTYCFVFGLFNFVKKHIIYIYSIITAFVLGMICWWYIETLLS